MTQQPLLSIKEFKTLSKGKTGKKNKKEEKLQITVAKYLRSNYPDVIFNSDIASGMRLPIWIAAKAKSMRSGRGHPDLVILEPRGNFNAGTFKCGLCLELKNEISDVYLKDGVTISGGKGKEHVREQSVMLKRLRDKGFFADFSFGWADTKSKIDAYFNL